ncbi:hypothetical protein GOV10_00120 [Candidatus Woesearchaeota archaeon]|nr:hypothetical protein [Candidatus Woesearchaeota archaeon]
MERTKEQEKMMKKWLKSGKSMVDFIMDGQKENEPETTAEFKDYEV